MASCLGDTHADRDTRTLLEFTCNLRTFWIVCDHKQLLDTHWYCKCVVIMDIFLRLWKTDDNGVELCHFGAATVLWFIQDRGNHSERFPFHSLLCGTEQRFYHFVLMATSGYLRPPSAGWRPPGWPYFVPLDQEAGRDHSDHWALACFQQ